MTLADRVPTPELEVMDLRCVAGADLLPLLDEEVVQWREMIEWDFSASAGLIVQFVDAKSLSGRALRLNGLVIGYSYFIVENGKGLLGDVYVVKRYRNEDWENRLIESSIEAMRREERVERVESQLLMISNPLLHRMPLSSKMRLFHRSFMVRESGVSRLMPGRASDALVFVPWDESYLEEAARMLADCYRGHIDSEINNQYRNAAGARTFLSNIIDYPGCGRFFQPASFLIHRRDRGQLCALVLASLISNGVGHITQVCVLPESRGLGAGYEAMRRAVETLEDFGCRRVSLSVTSSNSAAVRLYERMGFQTRRTFAAHVWDGL